MLYWIKPPRWQRAIFPRAIWSMPRDEKKLFLTFDDGPTPGVTESVLEILAQYEAKATFFCIGKKVEEQPELYQQMLSAGHRPGNHTYNHLSGWKTKNDLYFKNIEQCASKVDSTMFRPPYGAIALSQYNYLEPKYRIILWDVLCGDFDPANSKERCFGNVVKHAIEGSIVVFHDSVKAADKVLYALPRVIEYFLEKGFAFNALSL